MKFLPTTNSQLLRWTLLVLVAACAWGFAQGVRLIATGQLQGFVTAILFLLLAVGLWLRLHAARLFVLVILWFVVIVVPIGVINPFAAMDSYGLIPPPVWFLVLKVVPWVVGSLFVIHVLGKHKGEFRWWPKSAA